MSRLDQTIKYLQLIFVLALGLEFYGLLMLVDSATIFCQSLYDLDRGVTFERLCLGVVGHFENLLEMMYVYPIPRLKKKIYSKVKKQKLFIEALAGIYHLNMLRAEIPGAKVTPFVTDLVKNAHNWITKDKLYELFSVPLPKGTTEKRRLTQADRKVIQTLITISRNLTHGKPAFRYSDVKPIAGGCPLVVTETTDEESKEFTFLNNLREACGSQVDTAAMEMEISDAEDTASSRTSSRNDASRVKASNATDGANGDSFAKTIQSKVFQLREDLRMTSDSSEDSDNDESASMPMLNNAQKSSDILTHFQGPSKLTPAVKQSLPLNKKKIIEKPLQHPTVTDLPPPAKRPRLSQARTIEKPLQNPTVTDLPPPAKRPGLSQARVSSQAKPLLRHALRTAMEKNARMPKMTRNSAIAFECSIMESILSKINVLILSASSVTGTEELREWTNQLKSFFIGLYDDSTSFTNRSKLFVSWIYKLRHRYLKPIDKLQGALSTLVRTNEVALKLFGSELGSGLAKLQKNPLVVYTDKYLHAAKCFVKYTDSTVLFLEKVKKFLESGDVSTRPMLKNDLLWPPRDICDNMKHITNFLEDEMALQQKCPLQYKLKNYIESISKIGFKLKA